jgi:hypothetical protein
MVARPQGSLGPVLQRGYVRTSGEGEDGTPDTRWRALIGLLFILLLVLGGLMLVHILRRSSQLQDCVLSGRTNCAPIEAPPAQD